MRVMLVLLVASASLSLTTAAVQMRNLVNFSGMIKAATGRSALDFNGYGNWCGKGGTGTPVDDVDRCCMDHDHCYKRINQNECKGLFHTKPYIWNYKWEGKDGNIMCNSENSGCSKVLCDCDKTVVTCFAKNAYHTEHKH